MRITKCAIQKDENAMRNNAILNSYFSYFPLASFRYFVFSPGVISFRLFVILRGLFSLFRLFAWRYFVLRLAITPGEKTKKRINEMSQSRELCLIALLLERAESTGIQNSITMESFGKLL